MEDEKAMTGVAATKATTKKALLTGLRNGNLEKAVEKMEADEAAAEEGVLTQELLSSGLGRVGLTANGLSVACLSLSLPNQSLNAISKMSSLVHLQSIDLSHNCIVDLETTALDSFPFLVDMNLSHNKLTCVPALAASTNVQSMDLSANSITAIDMSHHKFIKNLAIDENQLSDLEGLQNLQCLQSLSACRNTISTTAGLAKLPFPDSLQRLALAENQITEASALEALSSLVVLDLSDNQLTSVKGVEDHPVLVDVYFTNNAIGGELDSEIDFLGTLPQLRTLQLAGCPLAQAERYRVRVLYRLPQLLFCDDVEISAEEKIAANNAHGEDTESLATTQNKYFPPGNPTQLPLYAAEFTS